MSQIVLNEIKKLFPGKTVTMKPNMGATGGVGATFTVDGKNYDVVMNGKSPNRIAHELRRMVK